MKFKRVVFLSALVFFAISCAIVSNAAAKEESPHDRLLREYRERTGIKAPGQKAEQPKSIWDDDSESNPYFRSSDKKVRTAA